MHGTADSPRLSNYDRPVSESAIPRSGKTAPPVSEAIRNLIRCPRCRSHLLSNASYLECANESCGMQYPLVDGMPVLINDQNSLFTRADFVVRKNTTFDLSRSGLARRVDRWLPTLSRNVKAGRNYQLFARMLCHASPRPVVLIVGGSVLGNGLNGLTREPQIQLLESDVTFGPRTQLICDAHDLPFENNSFDGVIVQAVLQYLVEPSRCIEEIERVLKPRGLVYAECAFMQQVVHGRYDFTRFTHLGLRRLFRGFEEVGSGAVGGPGMALAWSCQFFLLSLATSRWMRRVMHVVGRLTLFWLKYFDAGLIDKPGTYDAASGFFFLGRKGDKMLADRELVMLYRGAQ